MMLMDLLGLIYYNVLIAMMSKYLPGMIIFTKFGSNLVLINVNVLTSVAVATIQKAANLGPSNYLN